MITLTASMRHGLSFDEGEELAVGYNIWLRHDFRMEAANGDLVKRWATLPYLISRPAFPDTSDTYWRQGAPYEVGYRFFFRKGNDPRSLLLQGRTMILLLGLAAGLLVFLCSREIFGDFGGLVSLCLFAFSPHMLAFGGMVSTEMSVCLTLLGSIWCIWRLLHRVSWRRLFASLAFFGLLLLAKPTALVIFPITAVLLAVKLFGPWPLEWNLTSPRVISSRRAQLGIFCGLIMLHALFGWAVIWAHYDFRYAASPNPADPGLTSIKQVYTDPVDPSVAAFIAWSRQAHFLPEGYLNGIEWLLRENENRPAFLDGQWKIGGWRTFFLRAMWLKTPPALFLFLILGLGGWLWRKRAAKTPRQNGRAPPGQAPPLYLAVPFIAFVVIYFGVAMIQNLNIGHRHILPVYPAIYVLIGAVALLSFRWMKPVLILLLLGSVLDSFSVYPHYLAYFNPLTGGAAQGYKHLVDSSLDWGMNLPGLKRWLDEHNPDGQQPVFLAYFGTDSPRYYGIKSKRLPSFFEWRKMEVYPLTPGIYAISATLLEGVYTKTFGPWNKVYETKYHNVLKAMEALDRSAQDSQLRSALLKKYPQSFWDNEYNVFEKLRFARLCAWLRHRDQPTANIGYGILIWKLDDASLRDALYGPPVELADAPLGGK
ncbi:MAG TPA: glycosyltransferase family 39 protein [Opitutaceae bacterium]|nr:glycosyltransferase family 39 protein [Opitutaceae bacterium]